jgi:hypothetical protein
VTQTDGQGRDGDVAADPPTLSAVRTAPGRTVFTEAGNGDGWLATDYTADVER